MKNLKEIRCFVFLVLFILINLINITTIEASSLNNPIKLDSARIANTNVFISSVKFHGFEKIEGKRKEDGTKNSATFLYDGEIPILKGIADAAFLKTLNDRFYREYTDAKSTCEDSYKTQLRDLKKDPTTKLYSEEHDFWHLVRVSYPDLISIDQTGYDYTGGTHGILYWETVNIDLKNNKILELEDLFDVRKDYKTKLLAIIKKQAIDSNFYLFDSVVTSLPLPAPDNFYIADGKLYLYYPPYALGPYVKEFTVFDIPLIDLVGYIKIRFLKY